MAQKGRLLVIKRGSTAIAGLRDASLTINDTEVDISSNDSDGIRQLLEGKFEFSVSVSGSGVFKDAAVIASLRTDALAGAHTTYNIEVPGTTAKAGGTFSGPFRITSFEESGAHNGEVQYSLSLESAANVTFTAGNIPA